ncbi:hypothetical protein [Tenacibaculum aestuarii]|uniref:hypothetical protein n=1 Tax=Tenacibaculum aestuarii TaxID=362781 RepID=UPI00389425E0
MKTDSQFRITKEDNVSVDFYSELMNNYFPESSIEAEEDIRSIMVGPEQPMIFFLTKEKKLQAIVRTEGVTSGWTKLNLSKNKVVSFEIEYNVEENIFQIAKVEDNRVWVSNKIDIETTQFQTLDKSIDWKALEASTKDERINKVSLGVEHVLFATISKGTDAIYYISRLDEMKAEHYTLPENGMKIVQFELGNFLYNKGVFLLYDIGKERSLLFQSFPDETYNKTSKTRFESGEFINCFTLLEDFEGNDIVYAAGNKIQEFATLEGNEDFKVTELPAELDSIKKIRAAVNGNERSVWALDKKGLYYQTNHFFDQNTQNFIYDKWTLPILMVEEVEQFSCLKGKDIRNQLYSINTAHGSELAFLWQDAVTTLWNEEKITVATADSLKEVETYSAHIRFKSDTVTRTFAGTSVNVKAESNLFVYIDSKSYHIGPNKTISIPLEILPEFTIICPVADISSSRIILSAEFLKEDVAVNLNGKVLERLEKRIVSGDLESLKKPNGSSLIPEGVGKEDIKLASKGIQQMFSVVRDIENRREQTNTSLKETLREQNSNAGLVSTSNVLSHHGITLGDFFHALWDTTKSAFDFVVEKVEEGVRFVIKIGEQVFNWIVKTLNEIGRFIQKIFDTIKVFFKDLFEFLAFLFDWDAILETKRAFKSFTNNAVISLKEEIVHIKKFIDDTLDKEIAKFSPELVNIPSNLSAVNPSQPPEDRWADPRSNWLNSKKDFIREGKDKPLREQIPTEFSSVLEHFFSEVQNILMQSGKGFALEVDVIFKGFENLIKGEITFVDFLHLLLNKLAGLGLFLVKQLIDVILTSLTALLEVAQVGLNKEWEIPLISDLYKTITNGDVLTFLDVVCLFIAIPTTILYKIGEGEAPFKNYKTKEAFIASGNTVFKLT